MLEHRQATDGRNPFCACPLKIQWGRLRRFTFYFLRDGLSKFRAYTPLRGKASFFFLVAVTTVSPHSRNLTQGPRYCCERPPPTVLNVLLSAESHVISGKSHVHLMVMISCYLR